MPETSCNYRVSFFVAMPPKSMFDIEKVSHFGTLFILRPRSVSAMFDKSRRSGIDDARAHICTAEDSAASAVRKSAVCRPINRLG